MHAFVKTISVGLVSILTASCASTIDADNNAALILPSDTSLQTLTDAVSTLLNGRSVMLAPDSLTKRPTLIIDPVFAIGPDGNPIMGRSTEWPEHLKLAKDGDMCVLIQNRLHKVIILEGVECVAVEAD